MNRQCIRISFDPLSYHNNMYEICQYIMKVNNSDVFWFQSNNNALLCNG